ncbi:MAG: hypothetical protein J6037_00410 [Bacteroidales bacterium]|nr:hypothetical protein [Bacteroidales bacterium]
MKKLMTLLLLLSGVCAFAQHPLSAERQALIRKLSLPILADTLDYTRKNKPLYNSENIYGGSVSASAVLEYAIDDDKIYFRWPVKVVANSTKTVEINGRIYGESLKKSEVSPYVYIGATQVEDMLKQPLLAFILYTGGYQITEETAYPKQFGGSYFKQYDSEKMKPSEPLFDLVSKDITAHNSKAESVGSIYEITDFNEESLSLRVAFNGSGQAALINAYAADPYAVIIALGLNLGIHLYVYDVNVAAAPQYAYFSAEDVANFAKEVK